MANFESKLQKGFIKGVNAVVNRFDQPPGSVPRASNFIYTKRGSLVTCDGTAILNAFNSVPTANRGRALCDFLFQPTGVSPYFLRIMEVLGIPLGPPRNLAGVAAGGGSLAAGTYAYQVTALDGKGGESTPSNLINVVVGASGKVTLTWNVVPAAASYNVYRALSPGTPGLLIGAAVPVPQPQPSTGTVSLVDDGSAATTGGVAISVINSDHVTPTVIEMIVICDTTAGMFVGQAVTIAGNSNAFFNGAFTVNQVISPTTFRILVATVSSPGSGTGGAYTVAGAPPPVADTTTQTALFKMPPSSAGINYDASNIVAFFPACGPVGTQGVTPSGGILGNISNTPDMVQFVNQVAIALGNGYPAQLYGDGTGTLTNPRLNINITAISVDAFGVVTVTLASAHGITASQIGGYVYIQGVTNGFYNNNGLGAHAFAIVGVPGGTSLKVYNPFAIGQGASSGGRLTVTTTPLISTFTTAYPEWATGVTYLVGDIVIPTVANGHYYKCIQAGISAAAQPAFPTATGAQVPENSPSKVIWQEAGLTNTTAPPPPAVAHFRVFAGALWAWDTYYQNTSNGLDGPSCLRMSDVNNPNSWNPINQAFLDKDDGTEGMGIQAFTITGFGIPPEGSLVAYKQYAGYQIVGVFGSPNFLIQRVKSDTGCISPRSLQFTTGYGLMRFSHLGLVVFDGINDKVISEEIMPYIFPDNIASDSDLETIDFTWVPFAWATQTAHPPMYVFAIPLGSDGSSLGKLTRLLCYDLVLKAWAIIDLPFNLSTIGQARYSSAVATTTFGSYEDGTLDRWQATDDTWAPYIANGLSSVSATQVLISVQTPTVYNQQSQGSRVHARQLTVSSRFTDPNAFIQIALALGGEDPQAAAGQAFPQGNRGDYNLYVPIGAKVTDMYAILSGQGQVEIQCFDWDVRMEPTTPPPRMY